VVFLKARFWSRRGRKRYGEERGNRFLESSWGLITLDSGTIKTEDRIAKSIQYFRGLDTHFYFQYFFAKTQDLTSHKASACTSLSLMTRVKYQVSFFQNVHIGFFQLSCKCSRKFTSLRYIVSGLMLFLTK